MGAERLVEAEGEAVQRRWCYQVLALHGGGGSR